MENTPPATNGNVIGERKYMEQGDGKDGRQRKEDERKEKIAGKMAKYGQNRGNATRDLDFGPKTVVALRRREGTVEGKDDCWTKI